MQQQSLPVALSGVDVLAKAKTGTGKTLSFLLPALEAALRPPSGGPRIKILIVSPTRELASQVAEEIRRLTKGSLVKVGAVWGKSALKPQREKIEAGLDLLVGREGREAGKELVEEDPQRPPVNTAVVAFARDDLGR